MSDREHYKHILRSAQAGAFEHLFGVNVFESCAENSEVATVYSSGNVKLLSYRNDGSL